MNSGYSRRSGMLPVLGLLLVAALSLNPLQAGQADVLQATIQAHGERLYQIQVTVRHRDTGWSHYANRWEVIGPQGQVLAKRQLHHPHVEEQPFTRTLTGVRIPFGYTWVKIRAHDSVHGYGGREVTLSVP